MLWIVKKEFEEQYVMQYIDMQKQVINIWKIITKIKTYHIFNIWRQTICMDGKCLIKLPVKGFEWAISNGLYQVLLKKCKNS